MFFRLVYVFKHRGGFKQSVNMITAVVRLLLGGAVSEGNTATETTLWI